MVSNLLARRIRVVTGLAFCCNPKDFALMAGLDTNAAMRPPLMRAEPVGWAISPGLTDYTIALAGMEARTAGIAAGTASEIVWLLQHPPLYTAGTSAKSEDLIAPERFPVHAVGRGGQYTYHGPGQRVVYVMLDLDKRRRDVRAFVAELEALVIGALGRLGVAGGVRAGRVGVWVERPDKGAGVEDKIAAIGIRVRRWVSFHGISINVEPELEHFSGIVPCGISEHGVTSLADLGKHSRMAELDAALLAEFHARFGPTVAAPPPA